MNISDSIYICAESIKQKIFVYGKYTGGRYGAMVITQYFTKKDCEAKKCDDEIRQKIKEIPDEEYSRRITCIRGNMEAIIVTRGIVQKRKDSLLNHDLMKYFKNPQSPKKYYCHNHAAAKNFLCECGAALIRIGSEHHRDLTGKEDQLFMQEFLPEILDLD